MEYKKDYFKDIIREEYKKSGNKLYDINSEYIINALNNGSSSDIENVNLSSIEKGKFYFMYYNLQGKTSNMEKFNPILFVDSFDIDNTRMLFGISINFIPVAIRTVFFNMLCNYSLDTLSTNSTQDIIKQEPLNNIDFNIAYKLLKNIGFEWAIRKFDIKLVNKIYVINTNILPKFITMSTHKLTGVDDTKLMEIYQVKIQKQNEREQKMIKELLSDYNNLNKSLNDSYINLDKQLSNIQDTLNTIKKLY